MALSQAVTMRQKSSIFMSQCCDNNKEAKKELHLIFPMYCILQCKVGNWSTMAKLVFYFIVVTWTTITQQFTEYISRQPPGTGPWCWFVSDTTLSLAMNWSWRDWSDDVHWSKRTSVIYLCDVIIRSLIMGILPFASYARSVKYHFTLRWNCHNYQWGS